MKSSLTCSIVQGLAFGFMSHTVKLVEESARVIYLVLPVNPDELADEQLDGVVGGQIGCPAGCNIVCLTVCSRK